MMTANPGRIVRRLLLVAGVGVPLSLVGVVAWGQAVPPPVPDIPAAADDAVKGAADQAKGAVEGAKDAAAGAADAAKAKADPFADPPAAAAKGARDAADDAAKGVKDAAREGARGATDAARDAAEGARDATRDAAEGARDTARDVREGARDATRDLREGARDAREGARDTTRDARESLRDTRDDPRDDARRPRDDAADRRGDFRDDRREFRDDRSGERDDRFREDARDVRDSREARDDFRDTTRSRESSRESLRSSSRIDSNVRIADLRSADLGLWFSRSTGDGLIISDIATTGPMASVITRFGFREGDQILSVDGYRVTRDADFMRYLLADEVLRERVPVIVMRGDQRTTLHVEPIRLVEQVQTAYDDPLEQFGIILDDRSQDRALVWRVVPRSPAFYAGIQPGDVITTFHGERVTGPDAFLRLVQRAEPGTIAVEVNRNQRVRQFDVEWSPFEGRAAARTALRPQFDAPGVERLSEPLDGPIVEGLSELRERIEDRIDEPIIERLSERREQRIEDRRLDADGYVVPPTRTQPTRTPAAGPVRRALFPRLRNR